MERFDWLEVDDDEAKPAAAPGASEFDARYYFTRDEQAYRYGHFELALRGYGKALSEQSDLWEAWFGQVLSLLELGELEEAKLWAGKALDRFPQSAELLSVRALASARLGEAEDAMAYSDRAIAKKDAGWRVWLLRGLVLLRLEPQQRHAGCFVKAQEDGGSKDGYAELRIGAGYLEEGQVTAAKDFLLRAIELDGENPLAWAKLGECSEKLYSYGRARNCYERALALGAEGREPLAEAIGRLENLGFWDRLRGLWSPR
jgi:tetratricopeptide (TPR) repeat protein